MTTRRSFLQKFAALAGCAALPIAETAAPAIPPKGVQFPSAEPAGIIAGSAIAVPAGMRVMIMRVSVAPGPHWHNCRWQVIAAEC